MKKLKKSAKTKALKSLSKEILGDDYPILKRKPATSKLDPIMKELIKAREAAGMKKTEVADAMGKHLNQVSAMESGKISLSSLPILKAYAKAVGGELVVILKTKEAEIGMKATLTHEKISPRLNEDDLLVLLHHKSSIDNLLKSISTEIGLMGHLIDKEKGDTYETSVMAMISETMAKLIAVSVSDLIVHGINLNILSSVFTSCIVLCLRAAAYSGADIKGNDFFNIYAQSLIDNQKQMYESIVSE